MTFNEAIDEVRSHENTYDETSGTMQTFSVLDMIDELREEYAPTIEMTKEDKQSLLDLKSRATFYFFNQSIKKWQQNRIGLQMPYGCLTEG